MGRMIAGLPYNEYQTQWRTNNRERYLESLRKTNARRMDRWREWLAIQKDKPCMDCGGRFPTECMDFDHRDPATKSFGIGLAPGRGARSWAAIEAEIAKCDLVCANCHRIRTKERRAKARL